MSVPVAAPVTDCHAPVPVFAACVPSSVAVSSASNALVDSGPGLPDQFSVGFPSRLCPSLFLPCLSAILRCFRGFRPMMVCMRLYNGVCYRGDQCTFAHSSLELHQDAECLQYWLAWELDEDFEEMASVGPGLGIPVSTLGCPCRLR